MKYAFFLIELDIVSYSNSMICEYEILKKIISTVGLITAIMNAV